MTRRSVLLAGLGFPLGAITFPAGAFSPKDFRNDRKPEEWTSGEVKELLTKSPWAKEASVADNAEIGGMGIPRASASRRSSGSTSTGQANGPASNSSPKIKWQATVRWDSALPVREALRKTASEKPLDAEIKDFYVLNVVGNLPSAISPDEKEDSATMQYLKQVTKLEHKGDQVYLSRVELSPKNDLSPAGTLFYFSRMLALTQGDKEALFTTKIGPLDVKCKFALGEMLYRGALEL
jgi:hypothetical protein